MRVLAVIAGAVALAAPSVAAATDGSRTGAARQAARVSPALYTAVAVEACRDRRERPFGVVAGGERAARTSNLRCLRRMLDRRRVLTQVVLECSDRLGQGATPTLRALTGCSVSLLTRTSAGR
jgi:hypothetical protein